MCGISGFWNASAQTAKDELLRLSLNMASAQSHRGPDGDGHWIDEERGIALGHRRLAIIDLTETGSQPMTSPSGRYICVFNGEIYNFQNIRHDLEKEGYFFRGHSDTEVMLAAIEAYGFAESLKLFNGMFAIVLWDRQQHKLLMARDRLGKKPLYYGWTKDKSHFFFASELKALRAHPAFTPVISTEALSSYVALNYIPAPLSIYEGIKKLTAGAWLEVTRHESLETPYWSLKENILAAQNSQFAEARANETIDELETLLNDAVGLRMISDVPLGAFLSGGIDSSLIVALASKQSPRPIKTFSIGFEDPRFNEAHYARDIAKHLNTQHTEFILSEQVMLDMIPRMPIIFDEPLADSSQIPTFCVSDMAKKDVSVVMSGDGGDEIFAGYGRYQRAIQISQKIFHTPLFIRHMVGESIRHRSPQKSRYADILMSRSEDELYRNLTMFWKNPGEILSHTVTNPAHPQPLPDTVPYLSRMQYYDIASYLEGDILTKIDRACMAASLEGRSPLLDYRIIDFSWHLPQSMKINDGKSKWILRQILKRHIPESMFERPKQGFSIPQASWLRGSLKDYASDLLSSKSIQDQGLFNNKMVQLLWNAHQSGKYDYSDRLWSLLMFQAWHRAWM